MSRADDLTRLREEMQAGQRDRAEFVTNMTRGVAELRRANQAANKERRRTVEAMLAGFRDAHERMAREQQRSLADAERNRKRVAREDQTARLEFVANMAGTVAGLRKANQAANASAHDAWYGARTTGAVSAKRGGKWFGRPEAE